MKSPVVRSIGSASTKENTASAGPGSHLNKPFGLSNCVFKCEENESSPEVEAYPTNEINAKDISLKLKHVE